MEEVALRKEPEIVVGGGSICSHEQDYRRIREVVDRVGVILVVDMAYLADLVAVGLLESPVKYIHIVIPTTHKALRGPRDGVTMMGKGFPSLWGKKTPKGEIKMVSQLSDSVVFSGV